MEHFAKLRSLPDGLEFPLDLQSRIRFDADRQRLVYQGQMWKVQYDRLIALHPDTEYQLAIEHLFRVSSESDSTPAHGSRLSIAVISAVGVALLAGAWWQWFHDHATTSPPVENRQTVDQSTTSSPVDKRGQQSSLEEAVTRR